MDSRIIAPVVHNAELNLGHVVVPGENTRVFRVVQPQALQSLFTFAPTVSGSGSVTSSGIQVAPSSHTETTYTPPQKVTQADINAVLGPNSGVTLQKLFTFAPVVSGSGSVTSAGITAAPVSHSETTYTPPVVPNQQQVNDFLAQNNINAKVSIQSLL